MLHLYCWKGTEPATARITQRRCKRTLWRGATQPHRCALCHLPGSSPAPSNGDSLLLCSLSAPQKNPAPTSPSAPYSQFSAPREKSRQKHHSVCLQTHVCTQTQGKQSYHLILLTAPSSRSLLAFSLSTKLYFFASEHTTALQTYISLTSRKPYLRSHNPCGRLHSFLNVRWKKVFVFQKKLKSTSTCSQKQETLHASVRLFCR